MVIELAVAIDMIVDVLAQQQNNIVIVSVLKTRDKRQSFIDELGYILHLHLVQKQLVLIDFYQIQGDKDYDLLILI